MVGEFPELQGTMGRYYALADGEKAEVAEAIGEQYLPRFSGDELPASPAGQALAIADRLDFENPPSCSDSIKSSVERLQ